MTKADAPRSAPSLQLTAIAAGIFLAVVVGVSLFAIGAASGAPFLGIAAPIIGCGLGGFLAGKVAKTAGIYHGAFTGAGWIALEALGVVPTAAGAGLATLQETLAIIVIDVLLILAATAGGFIATRD